MTSKEEVDDVTVKEYLTGKEYLASKEEEEEEEAAAAAEEEREFHQGILDWYEISDG